MAMTTEQDAIDTNLPENRTGSENGGATETAKAPPLNLGCSGAEESNGNSNKPEPDLEESTGLEYTNRSQEDETTEREGDERSKTEEKGDDDTNDENKDDNATDAENDGSEKEDEESGGEEEEEEEEEEEPETEMTEGEKEAMYISVCEGDIATFQNHLDKPNGDINMKWFNENLLMVAMRTGQLRMAEFLIDIGIDVNYEMDFIEMYEKSRKKFDCYRKSCRQIAYEKGLELIVELIDLKNENWFPYAKKTPRVQFTRRPLPPPLPRVPGEEIEEEEDEEGVEEDENVEDGGSENKQKQLECAITKEEDNDSGHHSGKFGENKELDDNSSFSFGDVLKRPDVDINDEGYWSFTQRSSPPYHSVPEKPERPGLLSRGTKASLSIRKHTNQLLRHRKCSNSAKERNVTVVEAIGSYAKESRLWKRESVDQESVESIPFLARLQSAKTTCSEPVRTQNHLKYSRRQRPLTTQSAFSQVSKILHESHLLRSQKEQTLPVINTTQQRLPLSRTTKVNPWCHGNSSGVYHKLSDVKIQNKISNSDFHVDRQLYQRYRNSHSLIS